MHISIAGKLGSGKSTICNLLKERYGFQIYSTGAIQRELALQNNLSTLEMNYLMAQDLNYDYKIDNTVTSISINRSDETIIFDSRMAWKFAVNSFKVFLTVDPLTAAERVFTNPRGSVEVYRDIEDAKIKLLERANIENERYKDIYSVDNLDYSNYNLIIDSSFAPPEDLASIIYTNFRNYCKLNQETHDILLSPKSILPLEGTANFSADALNDFIETKKYLNSLISIVVFDGYHFLADGYHRTLAAIMNNEPLIPVLAFNTSGNPFYSSAEDLISTIKATGISSVQDFENIGQFRYKSYPSFYLNL